MTVAPFPPPPPPPPPPMESSTWTTMLTLFLASTLLLLLRAIFGHSRRRRLNLPPGPQPWPVIGNLHLMGPLPHRSARALSQKYGPLMQLYFGSSPVVIGSSVDMAKEILKTQDLNFASRPKTAAGKYILYNYSDIVSSSYGPYWRQARKICTMELLSSKRIDSYAYIRAEEVRALCRNLLLSSGRPILLKHYLMTLSLNVISRMVLGKRYEDEFEDDIATPEEFKRMVNEVFFLGGALNIGDSIPWLSLLDLQGYEGRMKRLSKKFDRFLEHVINNHIERRCVEGDGFVVRDMVDVLLQQADDPGLEVKLTRESVKALITNLLAGGTESTAVAIEWAISELLKRPNIFENATEELDRVIGKNRWVEEKEVHSLPYMDAIIKETMRLHPGTAMLSPRLSREDCTINGYDIPAGTTVFVNVWAMGRDPTIWEAPEEFQPERFIGKAIDMKGSHFELIPFGAGRRICPGYYLGLRSIQVSLANLLHGFNWQLPDKMSVDDLNMEEVWGQSSPRKVPVEVVVQPRLPANLYDM